MTRQDLYIAQVKLKKKKQGIEQCAQNAAISIRKGKININSPVSICIKKFLKGYAKNY